MSFIFVVIPPSIMWLYRGDLFWAIVREMFEINVGSPFPVTGLGIHDLTLFRDAYVSVRPFLRISLEILRFFLVLKIFCWTFIKQHGVQWDAVCIVTRCLIWIQAVWKWHHSFVCSTNKGDYVPKPPDFLWSRYGPSDVLTTASANIQSSHY